MAVACLDSVEDKEKFVQDTHHYSEYTSVKVELAKIFEMGVSNKPPEFIKMKPPGNVPMVESGVETPGGLVFESNAIVCYGKKSGCCTLKLLRK